MIMALGAVEKKTNQYRLLHVKISWLAHSRLKVSKTFTENCISDKRSMNSFFSLIPIWQLLDLNSGVFKSFLVQLNLIKNSMKVRRDYKWFNGSKFKVEIGTVEQFWYLPILYQLCSLYYGNQYNNIEFPNMDLFE